MPHRNLEALLKNKGLRTWSAGFLYPNWRPQLFSRLQHSFGPYHGLHLGQCSPGPGGHAKPQTLQAFKAKAGSQGSIKGLNYSRIETHVPATMRMVDDSYHDYGSLLLAVTRTSTTTKFCYRRSYSPASAANTNRNHKSVIRHKLQQAPVFHGR